MSYYIANQPVSININMETSSGTPINNLTISTIQLNLLREGITQSISGLYSLSFQQSGIYRVVFDTSLMTVANVDYVLIAHDTTDRARDDKIEFTLQERTSDSIYTDLKVEIDVNENKLDVINSYVDQVEGFIANGTYGLAALKTSQDSIASQLSAAEVSIEGTVISQSNENEVKIDQILSNQTSGQSSLLTQIGVNTNLLNVIKDYVDEVEGLLKNTTYGLEVIKSKTNTIDSNVSAQAVILQNEIITQSNENEVKIDNVSSQVTTAINEINVNENKLDVINSYVDQVEGLLQNSIYGLNALKSKLDTVDTNQSVNMVLLQNEIVTQSNQNETKIDQVLTNLSTTETNLTTEINQVPINPLLTTDSRLNKLNYLDTTSSQISTLTAASVWSYAARYLSGTSGVNQIDVNSLDSGFLVGQDININIALTDVSANEISGRTYPTSLEVELWKGGLQIDTTSSSVVSISETATATYRVSLDGSLIDTPAIDYLLVVEDKSNVALTQRVEFTAFELTGVTDPRVVSIYCLDSNTLLPIPDTQVYVKNNAQTLTVNKGITGIDGRYMTGLQDGSYNVILRKSFTDFTVPESLTVSADTTAIYYGSTFLPTSPTSPDTCVVYGWIIGLDSKAIKNAKVAASETTTSRYSGPFKIGKVSKSTTTDVNGYWELELLRSSELAPPGIKYKISMTYPGFSYEKDVLVPDSSSVSFVDI